MSDVKVPAVGDSFITSKSGVEGIVQEVVQNATGSYRIRIATVKGDKWTSLK